jgi:hypothetical protein
VPEHRDYTAVQPNWQQLAANTKPPERVAPLHRTIKQLKILQAPKRISF